MYNILSLLFGLLALGFAVAAFGKKGWAGCVFGSLAFCLGALFWQLLEVCRRVTLGDWSGLMDTMDAVVIAAAVLTAVTVAINAAAVLRGRQK